SSGKPWISTTGRPSPASATWSSTSPMRAWRCRTCSRSDPFDDGPRAGAPGGAHRHEPDLLAGALELVQQRRDQAGAARAERVAERQRAAVDVDAVPVGIDLAPPRGDDRAERLVD